MCSSDLTFCPKCRTHLILSDELENSKSIKCPTCNISFENPHYIKVQRKNDSLLRSSGFWVIAVIVFITSIVFYFQPDENKNNDPRDQVTETSVQKTKERVRELYHSLLQFKNKKDFHFYGFGVGYKYNEWLKEVKYLRSTPEASVLYEQGLSIGDLLHLGLEYVNSNGKETEYSLIARKSIELGFDDY